MLTLPKTQQQPASQLALLAQMHPGTTHTAGQAALLRQTQADPAGAVVLGLDVAGGSKKSQLDVTIGKVCGMYGPKAVHGNSDCTAAAVAGGCDTLSPQLPALQHHNVFCSNS
jgi:hypothetical protein